MAGKQAHVLISGRVQGVNYRYYTRRQAQMEDVKGWVRNRADGRVEAVFAGGEEAVKRMLRWCRQGPPAAAVEAVEVEWQDPSERFTGFHIRW